MRHTLLLLIAFSLLTITGCGGEADPPGGDDDDKTGEDGTLCAAIRGNGGRIWSHFGMLASLHEHYGTIDGIAGGSSGSITSFVTESMYMNPALDTCTTQSSCSSNAKGLRIALMMKTMPAYLFLLGGTEEGQAIQQLTTFNDQVQANRDAIDQLIAEGDFAGAAGALQDLFASEEVRSLLNPELIALISDSPDPAFHVQDVWGALKNFGSFGVDSDLILLRPGLISFDAFADKIGRIGSFYAGYGPDRTEEWAAFFDNCATEETIGMAWVEVAQQESCGRRFAELATGWRAEFVDGEASYPSRIDDMVGDELSALISTSVLTGDAVTAFQDARAAYLAAAPEPLNVDFDDVKFGYWGTWADLDRVAENRQGYNDLRTQKFYAIGAGTWREALSLSPAEPGLTRALEMRDNLVSAGGWSDLSPSLALKNMGCDRVALIMREGDVDGGFAAGVAQLLGMDQADQDALYDMGASDSSITSALGEADAIWCTNWDSFTDADVMEIFVDGYTAPVNTSDEYFTDGSHQSIDSGLQVPGCTAGLDVPNASSN